MRSVKFNSEKDDEKEMKTDEEESRKDKEEESDRKVGSRRERRGR